MERPPRLRAAGSSLRCDARSQPWAIGVCGSRRAKHHFLAAARRRAAPETDRRRPCLTTRHFGRGRTGDLDRRVEWTNTEVDAVAGRSRTLRSRRRLLSHQRAIVQVEIEARPAGARQPQFPLLALEARSGRDGGLAAGRRLPIPAGILAFEEAAEEALLQAKAIVGIKLRPVCAAVRFEPISAPKRRAESSLDVPRTSRPWPPNSPTIGAAP